MKKVLGLAVLMMVMLMSVAGLAVSDYVDVPVYLNVPQFVRLSIAPEEEDGRFNLEFDPANPDVNPSDTVKLLAEANVDYQVTSSVTATEGYDSWLALLQITPSTEQPLNGTAGSTVFDATATLDVSDGFATYEVISDQHIANVVFTISSL